MAEGNQAAAPYNIVFILTDQERHWHADELLRITACQPMNDWRSAVWCSTTTASTPACARPHGQ
jgi:hypothetical protein